MEVWVGFVELRQLPGAGHQITLAGKGAFTWITCWADSAESYLQRVSEAEKNYGLFVVDAEHVMPFVEAEKRGIVTDELAEQHDRTLQDTNFCIFGTFHSYQQDM